MDRSNLVAPADIPGEFDLLNGASGFAVWNGRNPPICPSAAPALLQCLCVVTMIALLESAGRDSTA